MGGLGKTEPRVYGPQRKQGAQARHGHLSRKAQEVR